MNASFSSGLLWFLLPAAITLLLGFYVFIVGWIGERTDDHPICRRCGFDLIGRPETSSRCSECGADLMMPRAVQHGHRRRRVDLLLSGSAFLLFACLIVGAGIWAQVQKIDLDALKPTWWLMGDVSAKTPGAPIGAWNELLRRQAAGQLSDEQTKSIAATALAIQADKTQTWNVIFGNFIQNAHAANILTDEQWKAYIHNGLAFSLELRPKVRRSDSIPAWIVEGPHRIGNGAKLYLRTYGAHGIGELIREPNGNARNSTGSSLNGPVGGGKSGYRIPLDKAAATTAPAGVRSAELEFDVEIRTGWNQNDPSLGRWTERVSGTWELVDDNTTTVEIIDDPSFQSNVQSSVRIDRLEFYSRDSVDLSIRCDGLKVPLACDVYIRADGREQKFTSFTARPGSSGYGTGGQLKLDAQAVDLVFRPSESVARNTVEMTKMWNGTFEIKNVPLKRRPATTQP